MTLIEAIDVARSLINEPLDSSRTFPDNTSTFFTDAILTQYFNLIQSEIQQDVVQAFEDYFVTDTTFSIVSGCADYALPGTFIKARRVEDIKQGTRSTVEILPITMNDQGRDFVRWRLPVTSWCGGYFIRGNSIVFEDTPTFTQGSAVRMFFVKRLTDLTASTSVSELPIETHRVIPYGIAKLALHQQQSDNNFATAEYEKQRASIQKQVENRQIQRPRYVRQTKYLRR